MAKFRLKNVSVVDAVILAKPIAFDGHSFQPGDYLITTESGDMHAMSAYDFGLKYEPVIPRGRKPKSAVAETDVALSVEPAAPAEKPSKPAKGK